MSLTRETIAALPKVLLHDHLDGGLRPATMLELAPEVGHQLPAENPQALAEWFVAAADSGSLVRYLETFEHTVAVMQTTEALARVAREAVVDLAADGVVYAELRYAPEQHLRRGLSLQQVVDAVHDGIEEGKAEAARAGHTIEAGTLLSAMRQADRADEIAALTLENRDRGAVGFDIAGPEDGFGPGRLRSAFQTLREANFPYTIHAGEAAGPESIWEALQVCGALRLGHGVRIIEDIELNPPDAEPGTATEATLGSLASWVLDRQVPLEVCPCSNLQTGIATTVADHPISTLWHLGFAVTINTDNRLMSGTSMSHEMELLVSEAGWTLDDLEEATLLAAWNSFAPHHIKQQIVTSQIEPGFAAARA